MKKTSLVLIIAILLIIPVSATDASLMAYGDRILQISSGKTFGLGQILEDLKGAPIIFVGEQHSSTSHHDLQLRILRTLNNLGIPVVIGLEMFTAGDQEQLDSWVKGTIPEAEFISIHEKNWGDTWPLYRSIYIYARGKGVPMLGLNVPEEITTQAAKHGFSSLSPDQRSELPMVSCNVAEKYRSFIQKALSVHGSSENIREFENFCEAQLIWDTTMAYRLVRYLEQNPGRKVVVLAGNSHSWRPGIPEQLNRFADSIDYRIILPEVPPVQTRHTVDGSVGDYLWLLE